MNTKKLPSLLTSRVAVNWLAGSSPSRSAVISTVPLSTSPPLNVRTDPSPPGSGLNSKPRNSVPRPERVSSVAPPVALRSAHALNPSRYFEDVRHLEDLALVLADKPLPYWVADQRLDHHLVAGMPGHAAPRLPDPSAGEASGQWA